MADLRFAVRSFAKTPVITGVAVLSLALGIGANAAIYSIFDQVLVRPLPVADPRALVNLVAPGPKPGSQSCNDSGDCDATFSYAMFRDLEAARGPFTGVAAYRIFGANLATGDRTRSASALLVSGSYFGVLGLRPALGRLLGTDDDVTPGEHPVAVLSHRFWTTDLGADPTVLNRTVVVNGLPFTIVGVAPFGFDGTTIGSRPAVFVPLSMRAAVEPATGTEQFDRRTQYWAYVLARLKPGVAMDQAATEINSVYGAIVNDVEAPLQEDMSAATMERFRAKRLILEEGHRGQSQMQGEARAPLLILFAITGVVLLIACANIANLVLATGAGRGQEMAVRASLGASRGQLLAQLLAESLLLAAAGGLVSVVVAVWTLDSITAMLPPDAADTLAFRLSPSAIAFTAVLSLATGLLFGLYPALHSTRTDLSGVLKASSGQPSGARTAARFRSVLVTSQIALSMALLVVAGLFIRSLVNLSREELGIRADNLVTFSVAPAQNGYPLERSLVLFEQLEDELAAIPGVTGVTAAMVPVLTGSAWGTDVGVEGFERGPDTDANARLNRVAPAFFGALGIPLLAGREFTRADGQSATRVAIVNEAFAEKFGLGRDPVGKRMSEGNGDELDIEIVGLVQNAKYDQVRNAIPPVFFTPYRQYEDLGSLTFYARGSASPDELLRAIPPLVARLDPNLPVDELATFEQRIREGLIVERLISQLGGAFAGLATLLAAIGLYGVLAYSVAQRTREIGLRMALGAGAEQVRRMVLRQVSRWIAIGIAAGLVAALAIGRLARTLLYELAPYDPVVIASVTVLLAGIALAAALVPALRASRVEPMRALRYE
jgi:predicted permease